MQLFNINMFMLICYATVAHETSDEVQVVESKLHKQMQHLLACYYLL